jgi:hypothetical protein
MKIYQVYSGEEDKHGFQREYYQATFISKEKALEHCERIVNEIPLYGDILEEVEARSDISLSWFKQWHAVGWGRVTICALYEREVDMEV